MQLESAKTEESDTVVWHTSSEVMVSSAIKHGNEHLSLDHFSICTGNQSQRCTRETDGNIFHHHHKNKNALHAQESCCFVCFFYWAMDATINATVYAEMLKCLRLATETKTWYGTLQSCPLSWQCQVTFCKTVNKQNCSNFLWQLTPNQLFRSNMARPTLKRNWLHHQPFDF